MTKRLFNHDPDTRTTTVFEDLGSDGFALHTSQDVEPILDSNKAKQNAGREYYAQDPDMWRVASIPATVQLKWLVEDGIDIYNPDHAERIKKKLNDPDWQHLKTANVII